MSQVSGVLFVLGLSFVAGLAGLLGLQYKSGVVAGSSPVRHAEGIPWSLAAPELSATGARG